MASAGPRPAAVRAASSHVRHGEDRFDLHGRLEEMQQSIVTALRVNKHLNEEVEKYIISLDRAEQDRNAWQRHARSLARQLVHAKKLSATTGGAVKDVASTTATDAEVECLAAELGKLPSDVNEAGSSGSTCGIHQRDPADECQRGVTEQMRVTSSSGTVVQLSLAQERLLAVLVKRGREAGWLVNSHEVTLGAVLGKGMFGVTHTATWRGTSVAVKLVRISQASELTSFLREVEALAALRHPHVLPFLGAVMQAPDRFWLLSELQPGGTLAQWLYPSGQPSPGMPASATPRSFMQRLQMAYEVAQGMQALESCSPPILHRDLKPSNIFVDAGGHARLGDFGLARRLVPGDEAGLTGETGTYLYMAPEVMRHEVYDSRADVWSWGVLLVELLTALPPYSAMYLSPIQVAMGVAEETLAPEVPDNLPTDLQVLGRLVCDFSPDNRPDFALINQELAQVIGNLKCGQRQQAPASGVMSSLVTSAWNTIFGRIYSTPEVPAPDTPRPAAGAQAPAARPHKRPAAAQTTAKQVVAPPRVPPLALAAPIQR